MYLWNKAGVAANYRFPSLFKSVCTALRLRFPLTLQGTFTLGLALYLLIHGLANRNAYEILLGAVLTILLGILLGIGYLVRRNSASLTPVWQIPHPVCAVESVQASTPFQKASPVSEPDPSSPPATHLHQVGGIPHTPLFFRVHFEIRGKLMLGNRGVLDYSADWSGRGRSERRFGGKRIMNHWRTGATLKGSTLDATSVNPSQVPGEITGTLPIALGGQFQGHGYRTLRDIFGMVRFPLPPVLHRTFAVLSAPSRKQIQLRLDPSLGVEEKRTLRSADEERYFMREYAPGDRFRDINWKTSSRLAFLVTRIAPQAQEKTRILPVAFRCFGPSKPDLLAVWALDRCKAWLFQFLWTVRREHPEFILRITTPFSEDEISTDEDTERFCEEIVGYSYRSLEEEERFASLVTTQEEVFVFSTNYDGGLSRFLGGRFDHLTHLYVTAPLRRFGGSQFFRYGRFQDRSQTVSPSQDSSPESSRVSSLSPAPFRISHCLEEGGIVFPPLLIPSPLPPVSIPRPLRGTLEIEYVEVSL